jgi:uncharacterized protein YqgV (UPF0045/DUF77 family)
LGGTTEGVSHHDYHSRTEHYPFQENYRELIQDFVKHLERYQDLRVTVGPTSTVIVGEYARVMDCITEMLPWSYDQHGRSVFVAKFIPGYDPK